jgi:hypothetical protein
MPNDTAGKFNVLSGGKKQYLIAARRDPALAVAGLRPFASSTLDNVISTMGIDVVRVLKPRVVSTLAATADAAPQVYVARVEPERARLLKSTAPPQMILEEDHFIGYGGPVGPLRAAPSFGMLSAADLAPRTIRIMVVGEGDRPIAGADVMLMGEGWPAQGQTDANGEVALQLYTLPGHAAKSLFVSTKSGYWDRYIRQPPLDENNVNVVRLKSLSETIQGFPRQYRLGWGAKLMGLEAVPETLTGAGVRVAVIDSGADTSHPLLAHIKVGADFTDGGAPNGWMRDVVGHGSHCVGTIAARGDGNGLRGFAPGAEVHVLKIFPGGRFSSLLDALDYCISNEIDVVNMSLGSDQQSSIVEQKLQEAVQHGIACIVAAGNSGGPVQYPAASPNVLAVAAMGMLSDLEEDTWDSTQVVPRLVAPNGIFSPTFTCFGPEIAVCAPGVSVISTVPGGGFEPQSGTSMAAPHVTGLATLILAHHPAFHVAFKQRGPQRVAALFAMLRQICAPTPLDRERAGAGVPLLSNVLSALQGVAAPPPTAPGPTVSPFGVDPRELFARLLQQQGPTFSTWPFVH